MVNCAAIAIQRLSKSPLISEFENSCKNLRQKARVLKLPQFTNSFGWIMSAEFGTNFHFINLDQYIQNN